MDKELSLDETKVFEKARNLAFSGHQNIIMNSSTDKELINLPENQKNLKITMKDIREEFLRKQKEKEIESFFRPQPDKAVLELAKTLDENKNYNIVIQMRADNPYVTNVNGEKIHFLKPRSSEIKIKDIALHSSKECRYNGLIKGHYSNAEHQILGSRMASNNLVARCFYIHDAAEYVFSDVPSPVKRLCPDYCKLIDDFQDFLYRIFIPELNDPLCDANIKLPDEVKEIDWRITASEMKQLRNQPADQLEAVPYPNVAFQMWEPKVAYEKYMEGFRKLFPNWKWN